MSQITDIELNFYASGYEDTPMRRLARELLALRKEREAAVPVVPAAYEINADATDYHRGWNACRAAMLAAPGKPSSLREGINALRELGGIDAEKILAERDDLNECEIPEGWKLVPIEPTMQQEFAGYKTLTDTGKMSRLMKTRIANIYRAMLAAAPGKEG